MLQISLNRGAFIFFIIVIIVLLIILKVETNMFGPDSAEDGASLISISTSSAAFPS